jgi:3-phenylpropionate/cinnamic acid dioxygenase small subunit
MWELICREQVRDTVSRYVICVDSGRLDQILSLFTAEATFEVDGRTYQGREEIRSIFTGAATVLSDHPGPQRLVRHMITTHEIDVSSQSAARSRCYFIAFVGDRLSQWGRYHDEFELVDGNWKIAKRRVFVDGLVDATAAE